MQVKSASQTRNMPITINSLTMSCFYFLSFSNFLSILSISFFHAEIRSRTSMYYLIKKSANLLLHATLLRIFIQLSQYHKLCPGSFLPHLLRGYIERIRCMIFSHKLSSHINNVNDL